LAKRPQIPIAIDLDPLLTDSRLADLLEDIEREETPKRLLELAVKLQHQLVLRKQRQNPN
jgi:hypothetical protein